MVNAVIVFKGAIKSVYSPGWTKSFLILASLRDVNEIDLKNDQIVQKIGYKKYDFTRKKVVVATLIWVYFLYLRTYCLSNLSVVGKLVPAFKNIHNGEDWKSSSQKAVMVKVLPSPNEYGTMILKCKIIQVHDIIFTLMSNYSTIHWTQNK